MSLSRRTFLKGVAAGLATAAVSSPVALRAEDWVRYGNLAFDTENRVVRYFGNDRVSLMSLYRDCKRAWFEDARLIQYNFPVTAITPEYMEMTGDWTVHDGTFLDNACLWDERASCHWTSLIGLGHDDVRVSLSRDGLPLAEDISNGMQHTIRVTDEVHVLEFTLQRPSLGAFTLERFNSQGVCGVEDVSRFKSPIRYPRT